MLGPLFKGIYNQLEKGKDGEYGETIQSISNGIFWFLFFILVILIG